MSIRKKKNVGQKRVETAFEATAAGGSPQFHMKIES